MRRTVRSSEDQFCKCGTGIYRQQNETQEDDQDGIGQKGLKDDLESVIFGIEMNVGPNEECHTDDCRTAGDNIQMVRTVEEVEKGKGEDTQNETLTGEEGIDDAEFVDRVPLFSEHEP
jgi:hypothetical protein